jgi:hypothetical protein
MKKIVILLLMFIGNWLHGAQNILQNNQPELTKDLAKIQGDLENSAFENSGLVYGYAFSRITQLLKTLTPEEQLKILSTTTKSIQIGDKNVSQSTLATDIINAAYKQGNYNKNGRADLINLIKDINPVVIDGGITWVTNQTRQMGNTDKPLLKAFTFLDNLGLKLGLLDNIIANNEAYKNGIPANKQLSNTAIFNGLESLAMQEATGIVSKGNLLTKAITKAVNWFKDIFKFGNGDSIIKSFTTTLAEFVDSMSTQQNDETFKTALDKLIKNGIKPEIIMEKIIAKYSNCDFLKTNMNEVYQNLTYLLISPPEEILKPLTRFIAFTDTIEKIKNEEIKSDIDVLTTLLGLRLAISETSDKPLISTDDQIRQIYELVKSKYSGSNKPNYLKNLQSFKDYFTKLPVSNRATTLKDYLLWLQPILDLPENATFDDLMEVIQIRNNSKNRTLNNLLNDNAPAIIDLEKEYIAKTQIKLQEILGKLNPQQIEQEKTNTNFKHFAELLNKLAKITQDKIPENIMDIIKPIAIIRQADQDSGDLTGITIPNENQGGRVEGMGFEGGIDI